ncbi:MAG: hypothetical protein M3N08_04400 [Pseudomonadota bacterium]|nr:hypothetical protein [Pseudomonadota bacterium]
MTAETIKDLESYWREIAPHGAKFTPDKAAALLLSMVRRYEAGLCKIALQSDEQRPVAMEALGVATLDQVNRFHRLRGGSPMDFLEDFPKPSPETVAFWNELADMLQAASRGEPNACHAMIEHWKEWRRENPILEPEQDG